MRTGSSARPSCCSRMGNPVCVSCHPIFSPSWLLLLCLSKLGLCFSYLGIHFGFLFVPECEARIALGGFTSLDKTCGQRESLSPVTPSATVPQRVTLRAWSSRESGRGRAVSVSWHILLENWQHYPSINRPVELRFHFLLILAMAELLSTHPSLTQNKTPLLTLTETKTNQPQLQAPCPLAPGGSPCWRRNTLWHTCTHIQSSGSVLFTNSFGKFL